MDGGLQIVRASLPRAVATDWVTVADMSGTGKSIVESAAISVRFDVLGADIAYPLTLQVSMDMQRTGGTGIVNAWLKIRSFTGTFVADNTIVNDSFTPILAGDHLKRTRLVWLNPALWHKTSGDPFEQRTLLYLRARGSEDDTAWAVTDIKARIIGIPL